MFGIPGPRLAQKPFTEEELCPPDAFEDLTPDEQHFHESTGNEGASFERTYRRAGLVLWPTARRLAVLNQAGPGTTLPYLEGLTARWETSGASIQSPFWREADELSEHMLRSWSRSPWRADADAEMLRADPAHAVTSKIGTNQIANRRFTNAIAPEIAHLRRARPSLVRLFLSEVARLEGQSRASAVREDLGRHSTPRFRPQGSAAVPAALGSHPRQ